MLTKSRVLVIVSLWLALLYPMGASIAQDALLPCGEREFIIGFPRVNANLWCVERPMSAIGGGTQALTSLAYAPDGALYATRPMAGDVLRLRDSDDDALPDLAEVAFDGLRRPNGLAANDDALFIIGDGVVYRYDDDGLTTVIDDLPAGRGFIASGIAVSDDALFIGVPFPCDVCQPDDERHGTVMRFTLDGDEPQIIARGLRYPSGLTLYEGALWVTDSARDGLLLASGHYDEINRIALDDERVPHFGFPYCVGDNEPDIDGDFDCTTATAPTLRLQTGSTPYALTPYDADLFAWLTGDLLVTLRGSPDNAEIRGYSFYSFDVSGETIQYEALLPVDIVLAGDERSAYRAEGIALTHSELVNRRGAGLWPHFARDIIVSPEGWLFALTDTSLYVLRPRNFDPCKTGNRQCE